LDKEFIQCLKEEIIKRISVFSPDQLTVVVGRVVKIFNRNNDPEVYDKLTEKVSSLLKNIGRNEKHVSKVESQLDSSLQLLQNDGPKRKWIKAVPT